MADASVTELIFFVAAVVVAAALAGVIIGVGHSMTETIQSKGESLTNKMQSQIVIISDPQVVPYHDSNLSIYVKNVGGNMLETNDLDVFIDGVPHPESNVSVIGSNIWGPSSVAEIKANVNLSPGDHQVKVVLGNGVSDSMSFRIE